MLDIKMIRKNPDEIKQRLAARGEVENFDRLFKLDQERRSILSEVEALKHRKNEVSREIPHLKKEGQDIEGIIQEMRKIGDQIKEMDDRVRSIEQEIENILLVIPNLPDESVPIGRDESENVEVKHWGEPRQFGFQPQAHWDLGTNLGILDFAAAGHITGSRFTVFRGLGARLERALFNFMMDLHATQHGYTEILPPYLVHRDSMIGTGQLPKFEEDAFKVENTDYYLIPTAEVPVTNIYRDEILDGDSLPLYYCAYSACFRAEAGAHGRDTRGLIRQHQFDKVELVMFTKPEDSMSALEKMLQDACSVLEALELPYRVVQLCTGDLGISSSKTYDIEVWMPSYDRYVEISSCSNCKDYQARRANIRFRRERGAKLEFVHTLNGSGVAVGRCLAALLENYQNADGSVNVPEALQPYMGGVKVINP